MILKLNIKSLDKVTIKLYSLFLVTLLKKFNGINFFVQSLPTEKKRITLLRSPHVNKKAREQFEIRIYKKFFFISNISSPLLIKHLLINKPKNIKLTFSYKTK